jgi:hypothetical protein
VSAAGWSLTIDGCPFELATQGVLAIPVPSGSADTADWPRGVTHAQGKLIAPEQSISYRLRPLEGEVECGSMSFTIEDPPYDFGADGVQNFFSWLTTRDEDEIASSTLAATITAAATSFTINNPSNIDANASQVIWIEGEAMLVDAINSGTGVVTVNASGRGYYGTRAVAHTVDAEQRYYPEVWASMPWVNARRVILWHVSIAGVPKPVWRGTATRPRLARDGVRYELQCEHLWTSYKALRIGTNSPMCRLRGYYRPRILATVWHQRGPTKTDQNEGITPTVHNTADSLAASLNENLADALDDAVNTPYSPESVQSSIRVMDGQLVLDVQATSVTYDVSAQLELGPAEGYVVYATSTNTSSSTRNAHVALVLPEAWVVSTVAVSGAGADIPIDRTDRLPASWTTTLDTQGAYSGMLHYTLRGDYSDEEWVYLNATGASPITESNATVGGPTFTGWLNYEPRKPDGPRRSVTRQARANGGAVVVDRALRMQLCVSVYHDHWAHGIAFAINDTTVAFSGVDSRDWDTTEIERDVVGVTGSRYASRIWIFDGSEPVRDWLVRQTVPNGACVTINGSRFGLTAFAPAAVNATTDLTITSADLAGKPEWHRWDDGIANTVHVKAPTFDMYVTDGRSAGRYGKTKEIEADLSECASLTDVDANPSMLASTMLARVLGTFSRPLHVLRLPLRWTLYDSVWPGTYVTVTEWLAPNGAGGRGNTAVIGQVISWELDIRAATVTVEVLALPTGKGYAPCCRVEAIVGAVLTIATGYLEETSSDYAGSNLSSYSGVTNDGGAGLFVAGDKIQLVRRGVTGTTTFSGTVDSVSTGTPSITLTTSPGATWEGYIAAGDVIDIRYDAYTTASIQAAQKRYAYVGDATTGKIGGTADYAPEWRA